MAATVFSGALAFIIFLIDLWAIASVWHSSKTSGAKIGWAVLILVFPAVGLVIWGIAGPRGVAQPPTSKEHSKG